MWAQATWHSPLGTLPLPTNDSGDPVSYHLRAECLSLPNCGEKQQRPLWSAAATRRGLRACDCVVEVERSDTTCPPAWPKTEATPICPPTHPNRLRLQRFGDGFGVLGSDPQQGTRWTLRGLSPLLPVLEGGNTHTDQEGEFRLRLAEALSDRLDIVRRELRDPTRFHLTAPNGPGLSNAGDQLIEILFLHPSSSRTNRFRIRSW